MPMISARTAGALTVLSLTLALAGCGSDDGGGGTPAAATSASSASATAPLDFALVERLTAPRLTKDPNCAYGQWDENSTGVDEEFRAKSTYFRQFDCYRSQADVGGIPLRLQQSIYAEFSDAATAQAYAEDQASLYETLVDGTKVVVAGTGLETVDMTAYLEELKASCGCGMVLAP